MTELLAVHAAVTWVLVGVIWTVQRVHYPLFAQVGAETFPAYHSRHLWSISLIVGPLVMMELATALLLVRSGARNPWLLASFAPLVANWLTTFILQVPLHLQLARGYDPGVLQKLITANWWRTAAWSLRGVCLLLAVA